MKLFIALFLIGTAFALAMLYLPQARSPVLREGFKVSIVALAVATVLFLLFTALSNFTWRLF